MERISVKVAGIVFLCLLFWLCLLAVQGMVRERQSYAQQVVDAIGHEYIGEQIIMAPFVRVPIMSVCPKTDSVAAVGGSKPAKDRLSKAAACTPKAVRTVVLAPQQTQWQQHWQVSNQQFKRGLYAAKSYSGQVLVKGRVDARSVALTKSETADWAQAQWQMAVSDRRGLAAMPVLKTAQGEHPFVLQQAAPADGSMRWLQAAAVLNGGDAQDFSIRFELSGTEAVSILPIGENTRLDMQAGWPHPHFSGTNLPLEKSIDAKGFGARWHNPAGGQDNAALLQGCLNQETDAAARCTWNDNWQRMGVRFVDTTDNYTLAERSLKYGMLFIVLTFGTFFLYEVLRDLRIHPVQYVLVGAALTVFYLLLLSFSEQVGFSWAYLCAATACIGLIGWYLRYVFHRRQHAVLCSGALVLLYAMLYWLLHTDENTLMIGSVLVFALIALAMFLTRHVDWYAVSAKTAPGLPEHDEKNPQ